MNTTISSRTPEGLPNHCPICDASICIEPSMPSGDATCPNCGTLLWFFETPAGLQFLDSRTITTLKEKIEEELIRIDNGQDAGGDYNRVS